MLVFIQVPLFKNKNYYVRTFIKWHKKRKNESRKGGRKYIEEKYNVLKFPEFC